jgi:hypothetical protein
MTIKHEIEASAGDSKLDTTTNKLDTKGINKFDRQWGDLYECLCH